MNSNTPETVWLVFAHTDVCMGAYLDKEDADLDAMGPPSMQLTVHKYRLVEED